MIPTRKAHLGQPDFVKASDGERDKVEQLIDPRKQYPRIATRYKKRAANDLARSLSAWPCSRNRSVQRGASRWSD